ncbi:hypothetical protein ARMSODRAFT_1018285 [Armillaria solidipes]|uniref:Uncharacterized protein n=1 Tax=Armillaria solidipes TaxID=1076256 RepID=A0A2H3C4H7_9AGAR|nr:hypothetical protein ARMSODRAFT_1018285 [Armillaria solidipes]
MACDQAVGIADVAMGLFVDMAVRQRARQGLGYADGPRVETTGVVMMTRDQRDRIADANMGVIVETAAFRLSREHGKPPTMSTGCNNAVQGSIYVDVLYTSEYMRRSKERFNEWGKHGNDVDVLIS